jgi:hypothetical protein
MRWADSIGPARRLCCSARPRYTHNAVGARTARALDGGAGNGEGSWRKDRVSPARRELDGGSMVSAGWG